MALAAERITLTDSPDPALLLPFGRETGAAALHRGGQLVVVFDERRPLDLAALKDDADFAAARVTMLPRATQVAMPDRPARLLARPEGWVLALGRATNLAPVLPQAQDQSLKLLMDGAGDSVVVRDPETGGNLLIGTQRRPPFGRFSAAAMLVPHRAPSYTLVPTLQGVAVEPISDQIVLLAETNGFLLQGAGLNLAAPLSGADLTALMRSTTLTRAFAIPDRPVPTLLQLMDEAVAGAAAAPPRSRRPLRLQAAEAMMALGMGPEAEAVLRLAAAEDAAHANDPDLVGLTAAAALLAERPDQAGGIEDPRLDDNDEIMLWRAVRRADSDDADPAAAAAFAATLKLQLSYPQPLRDRLLPIAAETMALGGQREAAAQLMAQRPNDPTLVYARAILSESTAKPEAALAAYDALAQGRDRRLRAHAANRAVELRLATGKLTKEQAADALDKLLYAWRSDRFEVRLRERTAALRADAKPRAALAMLRETETLFPDQAPRLRAERTALLARLLKQPNALSAIDFLSAVEENADLLPDMPDNRDVAQMLADRLVTLDLPQRAAPLLEELMRGSDGAQRARFGLQLAALRLGNEDAAGARSTLADSDDADLPAPLAEQRATVDAEALTALGKPADGARELAAFTDDAAMRLRGTLLGKAADWPTATLVLGTLVDRLPASGTLSEDQQALVMQCAGAASQANDEARLQSLAGFVDRLSASRQELLRMMTEAPIRGVNDLPRAGREIIADKQAMAKGLPPAGP
jgi:hypothetical protein